MWWVSVYLIFTQLCIILQISSSFRVKNVVFKSTFSLCKYFLCDLIIFDHKSGQYMSLLGFISFGQCTVFYAIFLYWYPDLTIFIKCPPPVIDFSSCFSVDWDFLDLLSYHTLSLIYKTKVLKFHTLSALSFFMYLKLIWSYFYIK